MESQIELKNILSLIRRQIWLITSAVIAVLALTVLITFSLTPKYTATAKLLVDPTYKDLLKPNYDSQYSTTDNFKVDSEVELVGTDNVLLQVIHRNNLLTDKEFGVSLDPRNDWLATLNLVQSAKLSAPQTLAITIDNFARAIKVSREGLTYLISVSVTSQDAGKAAKLTNALVAAYIEQQVTSKISQVVAGRHSLETRAREANTALITSEQKLDDFLNSNLAQIERESGSTDISRLRAELERIRKEREEQSSRLQLAELSMTTGDYSAIVESLQNTALAELERQRKELAAKLTLAADDSANAVNLRAELKAVQDTLKRKTSAEVSTLSKRMAANEKNASDLRQQLRSSILSSDLPAGVLTSIYALQQNSEIARSQYQNLLSRIQELDAQTTLQVPDSRVVSAALLPVKPSYPNKRLIFSITFLIALGIGFCLAILREHFIGGFTSDEQVESALKIPLATVIPRQVPEEGSHSVADLISTSPISMFAEGVRRIRVKIEQIMFKRNGGRPPAARDGLTILVSSTVPGEGKSTVSLSLARTLAGSGKRVVLIDCDLRKPSIHRLLGAPQSTELLDLLQGQEMPQVFSSITTQDSLSGLTVIVGGRSGEQPTDELLMGDRIARLLMAAKKHFDYVIIDTPPVDPVVDSLYLARHADIIAFVVRWANTSQTLSRKAINALHENARPDTPIIAILNQKPQINSSKYYKYAGYYTK